MTTNLPLEVDVHTVRRMQETKGEFLLLDCREPDEFQLVRMAGSVLIPMQQIPERLADIAPYQDKPLVVHCHHGGRSLRVAKWLREQGFSQAQSMAGGIDAWSLEIDPRLPRY